MLHYFNAFQKYVDTWTNNPIKFLTDKNSGFFVFLFLFFFFKNIVGRFVSTKTRKNVAYESPVKLLNRNFNHLCHHIFHTMKCAFLLVTNRFGDSYDRPSLLWLLSLKEVYIFQVIFYCFASIDYDILGP